MNILGCIPTTEMGNTAKEREFYRLSEDVFWNCENIFYEALFVFYWQMAESTNKPITRYRWIWDPCPPYGRNIGTWLSNSPLYFNTSLKTVLKLEVILAFWSKIWSKVKWPLSNLKCKNAISIWYLSENELIWGIWSHIDLKQPRNGQDGRKLILPLASKMQIMLHRKIFHNF